MTDEQASSSRRTVLSLVAALIATLAGLAGGFLVFGDDGDGTNDGGSGTDDNSGETTAQTESPTAGYGGTSVPTTMVTEAATTTPVQTTGGQPTPADDYAEQGYGEYGWGGELP